MLHREEIIGHLNFVIRPPLARWFIDQIVQVLELAAAGKLDERIEVDCRRMTVREAVEDWELTELVEWARLEGIAPAPADLEPAVDSDEPF